MPLKYDIIKSHFRAVHRSHKQWNKLYLNEAETYITTKICKSRLGPCLQQHHVRGEWHIKLSLPKSLVAPNYGSLESFIL